MRVRGVALAIIATVVFGLMLPGVAQAGPLRDSVRANMAKRHAAAVGTAAYGPGGAYVTRVAGANRFLTSVAVSQSVLDTGVALNIVIVNGQGFADALSASGLAGYLDAPILFASDADTLPAGVLPELQRIASEDASQPATLWFVGGAARLTDALMANVQAALPGSETTRIAGNNRYETSADAARVLFDLRGSTDTTAFVTNGENWPDAIAAAPLAYNEGWPLLLTQPTALPPSISTAITTYGVTGAVAVGGSGAVGPNVVTALQGLGVNVIQPAQGTSRVDTAQLLGRWAVAEEVSDGSFVGVATSQNFPDGLAGCWVTGALQGVTLYSNQSDVPALTSQYLNEFGLGPDPNLLGADLIDEAVIFGGQGAIDSPTYEQIRDLLNPFPHINV